MQNLYSGKKDDLAESLVVSFFYDLSIFHLFSSDLTSFLFTLFIKYRNKVQITDMTTFIFVKISSILFIVLSIGHNYIS